MQSPKGADHSLEVLHFPIEAVRKRLLDAKVSKEVGPTAAVYCSAILQFLTSKVINEAVKVLKTSEDRERSQTPTTTNRKRQRSDNEASQSDANSVSHKPPHKKRRICPKDITRALQTDPSLKEWADLIQIPNSANTDLKTQNSDNTDSLFNSNNCLDGVVIALEGNFDISETVYANKLKKGLETQSALQQNSENIFKQVLCENNDSNNSAHKGITGDVFKDNLCNLLINEFISNPKQYCLSFLYHSSTILSQQLHFATNSKYNHNRFIIVNRSPISCLSMAMLFKQRNYLSKLEFRLYVNSHQNELFPQCFTPDLTVFIEQEIKCENNTGLFGAKDRLLMDDYLFELLIKRIASQKYGKYIFFAKKQMSQNGIDSVLSKTVMDILLNKKKICKIYWESDLKAFNNTQNPNIVNPNKRVVYSEENQIIDGLQMIKRNELQLCDVVYIHISLWMKPKKEFKRLVMAHLCRFESICFYALRHHDLDDRAKQIVQWIFAK